MPVDKAIMRTYHPVDCHQTSASIEIFSAADGTPATTTDDEAVPECVASVAMPPWGINGDQRRVVVSFLFGETQLSVTQSCDATGTYARAAGLCAGIHSFIRAANKFLPRRRRHKVMRGGICQGVRSNAANQFAEAELTERRKCMRACDEDS